MVGRLLLRWMAVLLGVLAVLALVVALVEPRNTALWVFVAVSVTGLAGRETYVRYVRDH